MNSSVYAIATMDTKAEEICFVADHLKQVGVAVKTVDVGTLNPPSLEPDVSRNEVLNTVELPTGDRGQAIKVMSEALSEYLRHESDQGRVAGVIGIGGSGGTSLVCKALRGLPIGLPKLMVSTVASGDTAKYVDFSDIIMMFSVVDVAGLNVVSTQVLANAAHAMAGMSQNRMNIVDAKERLALTMFGVTTPCVTKVRTHLEKEGFDCLVFHATGTGGRAMENLVQSGVFKGVLDVTTTEVADEVAGGIFAAGPARFDASLAAGIPLVLSVGAVDMVNFGALETVPEAFRGRNLHVHNAEVTLMRTTAEENVEIGKWIAAKLNQAAAPFHLLLPEGGVSMLDAPGQVFYDPDADEALFKTLEREIQSKPGRVIARLPYHINAPEFADALVAAFHQMHCV